MFDSDGRKTIEMMVRETLGPQTMRELGLKLFEVLNQVFFSIVQVDLTNDTAYILQSVDFPGRIGKQISWSEYLNWYKFSLGIEEMEWYAASALLERLKAGQEFFSKDIPYMTDDTRDWLTVDAYLEIEQGKPFATVTVRKSSREHLLKSIVDLYVYNSCDYFIYLDAKNNSFTTFNAIRDCAPLPPITCNDYAADVVKYVNSFVVPEDREMVLREMQLDHVLKQLEKGERHSFTCGIMDPKQGYMRKRLEFRYYDRPTQMLLHSCTDITDVYLELKKREEETLMALNQARTDSLTGLLNHQGIIDEITACLTNSRGRSALLFIDLDDFKSVNDTCGHSVGDEVLRQVASVLRAGVRQHDLVGRIGGDEFLVFLRHISTVAEIKACAQRLCGAVSRISDNFMCGVSCSIGVAISPDQGTDYQTLVENADRQAYYAKACGKNRVSAGYEFCSGTPEA